MHADRLRSFLGINRSTGVLLVAIMLIGAGEETWVRFLPKYLEALGASVFIIGLFDAIKTLLGALYAYPGGVATDRWGHKRSMIAFTALSLVGYAIVLLFPHWAAVLAGAFLFLAWTNLSLPASFSLVAASLPAGKHAMGIGVQSLVRRIPVIVGPVAGGILLDRFGTIQGVRLGVLASLILGIVALVIQARLHNDPAVSRHEQPRLGGALRSLSPELRRLLLSDILIRFCERIPFAWVVIYAMDQLGLTASQFGLLVAIEMAFAIACYVPAASLADRYGKEPFIIVTFIMFTLFPIALLMSHGMTGLIVAFAIRGLKEFGEPARKALIVGSAPEAARAQTVGAYYLVRDSTVTAGSLVGAILWNIGPAVNFWSAFSVGVAGIVIYLTPLLSRNRKLAKLQRHGSQR
jgi:MFS family permease